MKIKKGTSVECPKCGYTWKTRKDSVKACPYCKQYLKDNKWIIQED